MLARAILSRLLSSTKLSGSMNSVAPLWDVPWTIPLTRDGASARIGTT